MTTRGETNPDLVYFEINLEEAPFFGTAVRESGQESVEYRYTQHTPDGNVIEQAWKITAHRDYELPGPFDQDCYVAIKKLLQQKGGMPTDGNLHFTIYEIIQILGLPKKGENYPKIVDSILRISKTSIDSKNAFYSADSKSYESEHFTPWRVHFAINTDKRGRSTERHTIRFDDMLVRSFKANYSKMLDTDFYFSLQNNLAKRLYRLVDLKRGEGLSWAVDLGILKQLLVMAPSYKYNSQLKRALKPAHDELLRKGFLSEASFSEDSAGIRYKISRGFVEQRGALERARSPEESAAIRSLIKNQVWPNVARQLVDKHGPERCAYYVDALPFQKDVRNAGAWLNTYIEAGYPVPIVSDTQITANETKSPKHTYYEDPFEGPAPPLPLGGGSLAADPEPPAKSGTVADEVRRRHNAGEFNEAIEAFESLPYEEYVKYVGHAARHHDGNRYYVNIDGELYLYVGGKQPQDRHFLCTLDRTESIKRSSPTEAAE